LGAMTLSRLDIEVIRRLPVDPADWEFDDIAKEVIPNKRERDECIAKLERLGLL
jgi:hypothetical protein